MKNIRVFIDGQHGTTGLKIHSRLKARDDIEIVEIPVESKKDAVYKAKILNEVDVVFLCLPDDAARESVSLIKNKDVKILDPSTAHRISDDWTYGIPELNKDQRGKIAKSNRVTVPGCHATGFNICLHPLIAEGIVSPEYPVNCHSISGYSGGGKQMIAEYESLDGDKSKISCRVKNLNLAHKHLPEMKKYGLLEDKPIFTSIVGNYYNGMLVFLPINFNALKTGKNIDDLRKFYEEYYKGEQFIKVVNQAVIDDIGDGFLSPVGCNETNDLEIYVFKNDNHVQVVARFDNLGKGASGAAVQNMNIMIGVPENTGLRS